MNTPPICRSSLLLEMILLLLVPLTACSTQAAAPAMQGGLRQHQAVDGLNITLEMPVQPHVNQRQEIFITLADAQGTPINDADIYLVLDMTGHPMAKNQPIADAAGNGRYSTSAVYTMAGDWTIAVVANVRGQEHRATFTTQVNE